MATKMKTVTRQAKVHLKDLKPKKDAKGGLLTLAGSAGCAPLARANYTEIKTI